MTLPVPPRYAVIPQEIGDQAYAVDKPKRALFADFQRILSLAWKSNYQKTPALNEQELWKWLKLSRRQYFEKKAEMEEMGWLRSNHPRTGCVQFDFSRSFTKDVSGAENRTSEEFSAENRTDLMRTEEEDLIKDLNIKSSSSNEPQKVRKTAPASKERQLITRMIANLHLVFEPERFGILENRKEFRNLEDPAFVLGWIVKACQDSDRISKRNGSPIALLVTRLRGEEQPNQWLIDNAQKILPEVYMEKIGLYRADCQYCDLRLPTRSALQTHVEADHPEAVEEDADEYEPIFETVAADPSILEPINGSMNAEQAWLSVLGQLQMEMPRASFDTWVRNAKVVRFDGNTLTVSVMNAYARDWLESRLTSTVNRLLVGILNSSDVKVSFTVGQLQLEEV